MDSTYDHIIYDPQEDSYLLQKHIKDYVLAKSRVLDMGTGSGILAFEAAQYADSVLAADINSRAVAEIKKRIKKEKRKEGIKNIEARESDLFSNIEKKEEFDLIIFNPPYLPSDKKYPDAALDGGRHGCELIIRFLEQARGHLKK
ncbi:MAG: HemK2/MTQ2 family protein methyltransferase, partial [Candidatus Woesearchaeota archaeon]